jgi:hypothetical protein
LVDCLERFVDRSEGTQHVEFELAKGLFHHHGDQAFILDQQNALARPNLDWAGTVDARLLNRCLEISGKRQFHLMRDGDGAS